MAYDSEHKSAAELQREIEMQRSRVEDTIDQIQERLSPGQLVDELLAYTRGGGGEFVSNLQRSVTSNPLPVALLGVSLAWLMAKPQGNGQSGNSHAGNDRQWDDSINASRGYSSYGSTYDEDYADESYPVATITGSSITRSGSSIDEHGHSYNEFVDEAGRRFKARVDAAGNRAGHFMDETGNRFRGFTDNTGRQIEHFRDEAGNLLEQATGWASHTWQMAREKMHDARDAMHGGSAAMGHHGMRAGNRLMSEADRLNHTIMHQFRDQPLVGGALAFALGAAVGAALPRTSQEDAMMGEVADKVKAKAGEQLSDAYEQGKEKASELYGSAADKAGNLYQKAREGFTSGSGGTQADGDSRPLHN